MSDLIKTVNIGKTLASKLERAGVKDLAQLSQQGSETAFIAIRAIDPEACLEMLYALEGAVQGIRWHQLDKGRKQELRTFFNGLK
jgi:DNA transformation protein and related proteins